jgi:hypothetical protein
LSEAAGTARRRGRPALPRPCRAGIAARRALGERLSEAAAAAWRAVPPADLRRPTRSRAEIAFARQAAIYFAHVIFGATLTRAGGIFGRDRTTARHACSRIEDQRDDHAIDRSIDLLEPAIRHWFAAFAAEDGR